MSITSTTRKAGPFIGNGAQTVFPFAYKVFTAADVLVAEAVIATGVEVIKTLTTHYTVSLNVDQEVSPGGSVTMLVAPPTGNTLTLGSQVAETQGVAVTNNGGWYPEILNGALDKATILIQQLKEKLGRALVFPISAAGNNELPVSGVRAGKYLAFDASGNPTTSVGTGSDSALRTDLAAGSGAALVRYRAAGAGAVATDAETKLRQIEVSPEDYGAALTYNAAVDDRLFLQLARDAVFTAGGGTVVLNRKYALNSFETGYVMLRPKAGVSWRGKNKYRTGLRVGNGLRSNTQGISVLYDHDNFIFDITMEEFFIDFNGVNNLCLSAYANPTVAFVNRCGGNIAADVTAQNMVFRGASGYHFLYFGLAATDARNDNCKVLNCDFFECGLSIPGNQVTDHSSIYMGSASGQVLGNRFKNTTQDYVASAIEVHSDDIQTLGNWVKKYNHGFNIGGDSNTLNIATVNDNIFSSVVRGIVVFTYSAYTVNNLNAHGNTITLVDTEGTAYAPGGGIVYSGGFDTSTATSSNWALTSNNISMAVRNDSAMAYQIVGIDINPVNGLTCTGNLVTGLKGEGIRVSATAAKAHSNVLVAHNPITACGYTSSAGRRCGIALLSNAATFIETNIVVRDNPIVGGAYGAGVAMDYGIQLNAGGQFQNLKILDNEVTGATLQDINTPTAQTQTTKPMIRHKTTKAGHPFNIGIRAGWGSLWSDTTNGYDYEFRNKAGTNGNSDGWNATVYMNGDPNTTAPFNTVGTEWKRGDTGVQAFPAAAGIHTHRCTTSGTGGAAAVWKSAGNLAA
jgi:hypothetical protein